MCVVIKTIDILLDLDLMFTHLNKNFKQIVYEKTKYFNN